MQKIISLFKRDYEGNRQIYDEIVPGAEWVQKGGGIATVKIDGTACMIKDGKLYKRYDVKRGKKQPEGFIPAQEPDSVTGHWPGWILVGNGPEDQYHREAFDNHSDLRNSEGTYELVGPKIQGNPYGLQAGHELWKHGIFTFPIDAEPPRTFDGLKRFFEEHPEYEGIVWHHEDGRMVKIKRKDFGLPWPIHKGSVDNLKADKIY